jgi:hypothetical protein
MPDPGNGLTFEQAQAFAKKNPGVALAVMVDVLIEDIEKPLPPRNHPDYVEQLKQQIEAYKLLDIVNKQMQPLTALCRREMVRALTAPMPRLSDGMRNELRDWATQQLLKEAMRIGLHELLAACVPPTHH